MLGRDNPPSVEEACEYALKILSAHSLDKDASLSAAEECLAVILQATVKAGVLERSIGELIDAALGRIVPVGEEEIILRRYGLRVAGEKGVRVLLVATGHRKTAEIAGRYAETYAQRLSELPGVGSTPRKYEGRSIRFYRRPRGLDRPVQGR